MRIIAGEVGGRVLKSTKRPNTRPTQDRVKEALFNIIAPYVPGSYGIDLFSGTGNLGLEAMSRGAERFLFVEKDSENVKVIKENIQICGFEKQTVVYKSDVFDFLNKTEQKYDLILMDPPYKKGFADRALEVISEKKLIEKNGIVVVEHSSSEKLKLPGGLDLLKEKVYGDTGITIIVGGV